MAAANLLLQPSPFKWKPNRFHQVRLRPLVQPVKLIKALDSPLQCQYHPRTVAEKLPPLELKSSNSSTSDLKSNSSSSSCLWKFAVKVTAGVVLGVMLLMHRPKPAMAGSQGRIVATCNPRTEKDPSSSSRYRVAKFDSFSRSWWNTAGLSLYPCLLYFMLLPVLFILCSLAAFPDRSLCRWDEHPASHWYESYKKQAYHYLLFLFMAHATWAWRQNPVTFVTLNIKVNLSDEGRALHTHLNQIAETDAATSTYKGVLSILKETEAAFLKHPDCFMSASVYAVDLYDMELARFMLDGISREERYPVTNMKNLKADSSTSHKKSANEIQDEHSDSGEVADLLDLLDKLRRNTDDVSQVDLTLESSTSQISAIEKQDEYIEVVILVIIASKRNHDIPIIIKSVDGVIDVLDFLTSNGSRSVVDAQVFFLEGQEKVVVSMSGSDVYRRTISRKVYRNGCMYQ